MARLLRFLAVCFCLSVPTQSAAMVSYGDDLIYVADTTVPAPSGGVVALCHHVDYADALFIPVYRTIQGYALSSDGCTGESYRPLTPENFEVMQATGMVPMNLPVVAALSLRDIIFGHAVLILTAMAFLFKGLAWLIHGRAKPAAKAQDALAVNALVAMSHVAVCDGNIDEAEVRQISSILSRLTGRAYNTQQVVNLLQTINPSPSDIARIGQDLSPKDRQIVLEAALNIAVADGEIHPSEYAVVTDLAHRMKIGATEFRSALARISAHLETGAPV